MSDAKSTFAVVVGVDGGGKSTLLRLLQIRGVLTDNWMSLRSNHDTEALAPDTPTAIRNRLSPLQRAMFIGGHLVAEYEYLVRPHVDAGHSILFDSYYFKLLAKETLYGVANSIFFDLCRELTRPDLIVVLDVDPSICFARKTPALSRYEYREVPTRDDFVSFQKDMMCLIEDYIIGIPTIRLDGMRDPEIVCDEACQQLAKYGFLDPLQLHIY